MAQCYTNVEKIFLKKGWNWHHKICKSQSFSNFMQILLWGFFREKPSSSRDEKENNNKNWIKMSEIKHCVILVAYHESSSELLDAKASFTLLLLDVKSFKIPKLLIILYLPNYFYQLSRRTHQRFIYNTWFSNQHVEISIFYFLCFIILKVSQIS